MKQTNTAMIFSINGSIVCCIIRFCESRSSIENRLRNRLMSEITCRVLMLEVKKNPTVQIS